MGPKYLDVKVYPLIPIFWTTEFWSFTLWKCPKWGPPKMGGWH